jgi:hypothetical protein
MVGRLHGLGEVRSKWFRTQGVHNSTILRVISTQKQMSRHNYPGKCSFTKAVIESK